MSPSQAEATVKTTGAATDTIVWVNSKTKTYHLRGTHNYGTRSPGEFMCETAAKTAGYRAGGECAPSVI